MFTYIYAVIRYSDLWPSTCDTSSSAQSAEYAIKISANVPNTARDRSARVCTRRYKHPSRLGCFAVGGWRFRRRSEGSTHTRTPGKLIQDQSRNNHRTHFQFPSTFSPPSALRPRSLCLRRVPGKKGNGVYNRPFLLFTRKIVQLFFTKLWKKCLWVPWTNMLLAW